MHPRRIVLVGLTLTIVAISLTLGGSRRSMAQPPASPAMLPTFDYDAAAPGVQGPASPLVASAELRAFRAHQMAFGVLVPLVELQALLPAGFDAVPSQAGADTAMIGITFVYHQRTEVAGGSVVGPSSGVFVSATVSNTALNRQEALYLTAIFNDQATIDAHNGVMGPGSFRFGEVEVVLEERAGILSLAFDVADTGTGLRLRAQADGPAAMLNHSRFDPQPAPFRFANTGGQVGPASRAASQSDNQTLPAAELKFKANGGELTLPSGSLTIAGLGANVSFVRWGEVYTRTE